MNDDGGFDIADAVAGLAHLFSSAPLGCHDALDSNDDGQKDIADAVHILAALFSAGPSPAAPHPACGPDPTADSLGCDSYSHCPCPPDAHEPNDLIAVCEQLGSIEDSTAFPAGTLTLGFTDASDEDWFCYNIDDATFSTVAPRVNVAGIPPGATVELQIIWTCDTGDSGTASSTNDPLSDTVELYLFTIDCSGSIDDSMQIAFRVRPLAGPLDCQPLVVLWGDE